MAMTGPGMSTALENAIKGIAGIQIIDDAELKRFTDAVGLAIVQYIQGNAQVPVNVTSITGLVETGMGTGGSVSGTGVGTGTVS